MDRTWSVVDSTRKTISWRDAPDLLASSVAVSMFFFERSTFSMFFLVPSWIPLMASPTSLVATMVFSANLRTSSATTAKPRPASPARAASMAALSARRFVWSAMSEMTFMIWPMPSACLPSISMSLVIACDCCRTSSMPLTTMPTTFAPSRAFDFASSAVCAAFEALLATSRTVAFISSMAVAVSATLLDCSSAPRLDSSICAESSSEADETTPTMPSRVLAAWSMPSDLARSAWAWAASALAVACWARSVCSSASRVLLTAVWIISFNFETMVFKESESVPSSSVRSILSVTSRSPEAMDFAKFTLVDRLVMTFLMMSRMIMQTDTSPIPPNMKDAFCIFAVDWAISSSFIMTMMVHPVVFSRE